jgi:6-phosphogluconolactonase
MLKWITADDSTSLAERLSKAVVGHLRTAIDLAGEASLVVSGGSTPKPVFQHLSIAELDWSRVSITLADERWVPPDHADSNERLVRTTLMTGGAAAAHFVSLYRDQGEPGVAIADIDRAVAAMPHPFTVVILGMGVDGHTASLFAATDGLEQAMDLETNAFVVSMRPATVPQTRITLTRRALLDSTHCYLHITGSKKRSILEAALADTKDLCLPVAQVLQARHGEISVYWSP